MKVSLLMAQTLDGKIAKNSDHFPDWTESADKKFFRARTKESGVMIFGRTTFETLPGVLPGRLSVVLSRKAGEWDQKEENLVFTSLTPEKLLAKLETLGYDNPIVAGGTTINKLFAEAGLIDELITTISPVIFGEGMSVLGDRVSMEFNLEKFEKIGENTLALWYKVIK